MTIGLKESRIFWFDVVRGASALLVCANHLRASMFCDFSEIEKQRLWHIPFYFATSLGHQAVVVFFVLSGFFVGGSVWRNRRHFQAVKYTTTRLTRLWIVLIPALAFTAALDTYVHSVAPDAINGNYRLTWHSGPDETYSLTASTLFGNIFFLQTIVVPVFGSNGPLWSLANEFWYYLLFPLAILCFYPRLRPSSIFYMLLFIGVFAALPKSILIGGLIWLLGLSVYILLPTGHVSRRLSRWAIVVALLAFLLSLLLSKTSFLGESYKADICTGVTFAILAALLARTKSKLPAGLNEAVTFLSEASYSIYLFHFPLVVAFGAVVMNGQVLQPDLGAVAFFFLVLLQLIAACLIAWYLFERNTSAARRKIAFLLECVQNNGQPPR